MPRPTICPYTLTPTSDLAQPSLEHIIPDALGGPDGFGLTADRSINSQLGSSVDSDFINDHIVKVLAMTHGVVSRSGDVSLKLMGSMEFNGEDLSQVVRLSKGHIDLKMSKPVITDPNTGAVTGVIGWGDDANKSLNAVKKGMERKGYSVEVGETQTSPPGWVNSQLEHNTFKSTSGMAKIAYLALAYTFGDDFITGPEGAIFRVAYSAADFTMLKATGITGGPGSAFPFLPNVPDGYHTVIAIRQAGQYCAVVRLFSSDLLTKTFSVPSLNTQADVEGSVYTCSPTGGGIQETSLMDYVVSLARTGV